jgi:hypothetical protein
MLRIAYTSLATSILLAACGAADSLSNPGFDVWCDDHPCGWQTSGAVKQVGSWHEDDYAIALVSDDASVSQLNPGRDSTYASCFAFSLIAKIDRRSEVYLELDFLDDGMIDFSQRIPASDWERRTFNISGPSWYDGLRFIIRKAGPGEAIVAELRARSVSSNVCFSPRIELTDRPDEARCESDEQCRNSSCKWGACTRCRFDTDCDEQKVCALTITDGKMMRDCAARGSTPFGRACADSSQCASGFCVDRACSECRNDSDCRGSGQCRASPAAPAQLGAWPLQCSPGRRLRQPGEPCADSSDCMSNLCRGSAVQCAVGGCAESSAEHDAGSCSGDCDSWQVTAGTCD